MSLVIQENSCTKISFVLCLITSLNLSLVQNTVIVIVTGLGLLGLSTMFCDFVLLNYSPERKKVRIIVGFKIRSFSKLILQIVDRLI